MTEKTEEMANRFVLASLLTSYPDESFGENVRTLLADPDVNVPEDLRLTLEEKLSSVEALNQLRSEYIDLFDRPSGGNSLYETEYGRDRALGKSRELADLAGFYKAFGLEMGADGTTHREMLDHISVELEFYALLLLKQAALFEQGDTGGGEIVLDARQKFLQDHLGRFAPAICERKGVAASVFYSRMFAWCRKTVEAECKALGVRPEVLYWVPGEQPSEAVRCGSGSGGCGGSSSVPS